MNRTLITTATIISFFCIMSIGQTIDAVSSASGKLKITGGNLYSNYVTVTWKDDYNSGSQHLLKYGTSTSYGQQINLKPFTKQATVTTAINNLTPSTRYYAQFYRVHEGTARKTNFEFTTIAAATTLIQSSHYSKFTITENTTQFITDLQGRKITSLQGDQLNKIIQGGSTLKTNRVQPGKYLIVTEDNLTGSKSISSITISQ